MDDREGRLRSLLRRMTQLSEASNKDDTLQLFLTIRSDCRLLQAFYRDEILTQETTVQSLVDVDKYLIDCEEKINSKDFISSEASMWTKLQMVMDMIAIKDKAMYTVCASLLRQLGVDYIVYGASDASRSTSHDMLQVLSLFRTFRSLGKTVKGIELTRADLKHSMEVTARQLQISKLQADLASKDEELDFLRHKVALVEQVGAHMTIVKQHDQIALLERANEQLKGDSARLHAQIRMHSQKEAGLADKVTEGTQQIRALQSSVVAEISRLNAQLERELQSEQQNTIANTAIRTELSLWVNRAAVANRRIEQLSSENAALQAGMEALEANMRVVETRLAAATDERDKWNQMALLVGSARTSVQASYKATQALCAEERTGRLSAEEEARRLGELLEMREQDMDASDERTLLEKLGYNPWRSFDRDCGI